MMWTAVMPLKLGRDQKSRLSGMLSRADRVELAADMARHVLAVLQASPNIDSVIILSPCPAAWANTGWRKDEDRGLNEELREAHHALGSRAMLIIHGDLPLLAAADITAMCEGAGAAGAAFAPDRHGAGTNAIALTAGATLDFAFGRESFAHHLAAIPSACIVRTTGLETDIDTPDDLLRATTLGVALPHTPRAMSAISFSPSAGPSVGDYR
jgi:2-phospho-L-lactate guanylyltransferase